MKYLKLYRKIELIYDKNGEIYINVYNLKII